MKRLVRNSAVLVALGLLSVNAFAASQPLPARPATYSAAQAADSMARYRNLAGEAITAFKSGDKAGAKAKARELEKAWDDEQKALKSKSPDVWKSVDDAMDAFIKPLMKGGSPDPAAVQAAYDDFIAKLDSAARG